MKFAAVLASVLLFANTNFCSGASLRVASLTEDLTKEDSSSGIQERESLGDDGHDDFEHRNLGQLKSDQCAPMMKQLFADVELFVSKYTPEELKEFLCSPEERKVLVDNEQEMENDMKKQTDPCKKALDREMLKQKNAVLESTRSKGACEKEVAEELEAVKEHNERKLAHGRELGMFSLPFKLIMSATKKGGKKAAKMGGKKAAKKEGKKKLKDRKKQKDLGGKVYKNRCIPGHNDIKTFRVKSAMQCYEACKSERKCNSGDYQRGTCYLSTKGYSYSKNYANCNMWVK